MKSSATASEKQVMHPSFIAAFYPTNHPVVQANPQSFLSLQWVYAHGNLEEMLEYDILTTSSIPTYNVITSYHLEDKRHTFQDIAVTPKGDIVPVKVFVWEAPNRRCALVVHPDDTAALKYADQQMRYRIAYFI